MGQTDAGGGKKKMKERARRKGRKEGGVAICLLGPGIGFGFRSPAGRTDGGWRACGGASGPAARRAAAAAIIERGIHAFLPRCTPTLTPTYGRCINSAFLPRCRCHYIHSRRRRSHRRPITPSSD